MSRRARSRPGAGADSGLVSPDDVESRARFQARYDLPHTLLADPDREVIQAYGVWGTKAYGDARSRP